ncbi:MAG: hypothetical protein EP330_17315 [Deltaproteobacteria bacterium]|nr:MAG: hypothetical protein EP330_17315 [Deltaproteobacteria bacterium]
MLGLDVACLALIAKRDELVLGIVLWGWGAVLGGILVAAFTGSQFATMSVLGLALFVHGPVNLLVAGYLTDDGRRRVLGAMAAVLALVGLDAYWIEPAWIEVSETTVVLRDAPRPLTIAVLSDMQTDGVTGHEARALRYAMDARPDLVLFPGDFVQVPDPTLREAVRADLRAVFEEAELSAPLGVYAVDGNVEQWQQGEWTALFDGIAAGATWKSREHFSPEDGIHITVLPFLEGFDTSAQVPDHDGLHIVMAHAPDFALGEVDADLLVAGHVHGGQVRLPFVGPLITFSRAPRAWTVGHTEIEPGKHLFVSRGVGMERRNAPRLRFNCRPEVMILHVVPE